jgi:beta-glucuronidase
MKQAAAKFAILFLIAGAAAAAAEPSNVIAHVAGRSITSLNGTWHIIVDPSENGLGGRYFEDKKSGGEELVEYDFEHSPTLNVLGN